MLIIKKSNLEKQSSTPLLNSSSRKQLEALQMDVTDLHRKHDGSLVKGVILTLEGGLSGSSSPQLQQDTADYHCYSRYFAPWNGIPEDPVTG